jgi:hypothetical protein
LLYASGDGLHPPDPARMQAQGARLPGLITLAEVELYVPEREFLYSRIAADGLIALHDRACL